MKVFDVRRAASDARAANPTRPATAIVHDSADARLLVFRIAPGQSVAPHTNLSTVMLTAIAGHPVVTGRDEEREIAPGDVVVYEPNELHGIRAVGEEAVLLATITPRPGTRGE